MSSQYLEAIMMDAYTMGRQLNVRIRTSPYFYTTVIMDALKLTMILSMNMKASKQISLVSRIF